MTRRPKLLDLFCGAGGASVGYHRAGFDVVGVDLDPAQLEQYPFESIEADALEILGDLDWVRSFDAVHASPPCQGYSAIGKQWTARDGRTWPLLTESVRDALEVAGVPYIIENPAARPDVVLCGAALGLSVLRHRKFELGGWTMAQPAHPKHLGYVRGWRHGVYRDGVWPDGRVMVAAYGDGGGKASIEEMQQALGMPWVTTRHGLTEAVAPAYAECVGAGLRASLGSTATAVAA
jgi:hypothetical protein